MNLCAIQLKPIAGDIRANRDRHLKYIDRAIAQEADLIVFPELSLTGYEPTLAASLAMKMDDPRLDIFQEICDIQEVCICVGLPLQSEQGIQIAMGIFQPYTARHVYAKQFLHEDEIPFFVPGNTPVLISWKGYKIAPAICYESLLPEHLETSLQLGANVYMASVAKATKGVKKAYAYFPQIAAQYKLPVIMSNCLGPCDNFIGGGTSSAWNAQGSLTGQLDDKLEGILMLQL